MRAAFHTLGCKTNAYETQAVREQFEKEGFQTVPFSEPADIYIVNTCSVTAVAAQKSRQILRRCRKLSPESLVVACGCYAQEAAEQLLSDGSIDLVVGNNEKSRIVSLVRNAFHSRPERLCLNDLTHCTDYEEQSITHAGTRVRAYVKIQDGCNRFCSYCIIPYLRGRSRSRRKEEILKEVRILSEGGIREIVLTGIDISDYRESEPEGGEGSALAELILRISEIEGIDRIRLGSLEAGIISGNFIRRIRDCEKLCPHFHLSLQSGCDETLKRMNRHYTTAEFSDSVRRLRDSFADPAITTDVIAGFAGETEEEFERTKEFIRKTEFAQMHVFPYSRRKGTRADRMPGQLTKAEKAQRAAELIQIGRELQLSYLSRFLNRQIRILTEEEIRISGKACLVGFTPEYIRAAVPAEQADVNKIVTLCPEKITWERKEPVLQ